ncbi:MAG: preprotein translocase subunit SecY [Rhodopirellula sp. JB055]|uniref:preprotein translocase subunit SecY n=1 Tax=Rhodopirellula sp. JB055 TaxID=3342846 RepID=UPI003709D596
MFEKLRIIFSIPELRKKVMLTIGLLAIYRIGFHIPLPMIATNLDSGAGGGAADFFEKVSVFAASDLRQATIFGLGIMPYISASIIFQLLGSVYKPLEELKKEGEAGRKKLNEYTRYLTVVICLVQSYMYLKFMLMAGANGQSSINPNFMNANEQLFFGWQIVAVLVMTTGTVFLMWLGEQITERGIGNGISLIIFAGIVVNLPSAVFSVFQMVSEGQLNALTAIFLLALALGLTTFIVFVERGQRRVTMQFARRGGRQATQAQTSYLPMKINMSGVIPPIFASSLVLFPGTIASFAGQNEGFEWLTDLSQQLSPGNTLYLVFYGALIVFFTYFYTALTFNSDETADNLKRQSAVIPGIRPGKQTANYLDGVLNRVTLWGSMYLLGVCLLPDILNSALAVPFAIGGTGLLIVVVVAMDSMAQLQNHLVSQQYESVLKKSDIKNYRRSSSKIRR